MLLGFDFLRKYCCNWDVCKGLLTPQGECQEEEEEKAFVPVKLRTPAGATVETELQRALTWERVQRRRVKPEELKRKRETDRRELARRASEDGDEGRAETKETQRATKNRRKATRQEQKG